MSVRLIAVCVSVVGLAIVLVMWSISQPTPRPRPSVIPATVSPDHSSAEVSPGNDTTLHASPSNKKTTKLPVAGTIGYFVVVGPDGSSYLESPDGKQQLLKSAPTDIAALKVEQKVTERLNVLPKLTSIKPEQLLFLAKGVIAVPIGGIVTFVGDDRVVVLEDTGTVVYYTDGRRSETRERRTPNAKGNP
jgi:hypothetical protein